MILKVFGYRFLFSLEISIFGFLIPFIFSTAKVMIPFVFIN